ncbi:unnamed protein product [Merluccius merluccius]
MLPITLHPAQRYPHPHATPGTTPPPHVKPGTTPPPSPCYTRHNATPIPPCYTRHNATPIPSCYTQHNTYTPERRRSPSGLTRLRPPGSTRPTARQSPGKVQ